MKKTNISNLFFTAAVGILLVGCGGGAEYDTSKDFTKLEGNSNPTFEQIASTNVKEVDVLAEQYRVEQANKNTTLDNSTASYGNNTNDTKNEDPNKQIGTMPVANPSLPPPVNLETNNSTPPQGEVNVISESNTN